MVDDEFGIDTKQLIEQFLIVQRQPRELSHRIDADGAEPCDDAAAEAPEVGHRLVVPQLPSVAHLVEFGNAYAILVGWNMLGDDIHRHLAEVEVGADARRGGDASRLQHLPDHGHCQLVGGHLIRLQVIGDVGEDFVDGIDVDVLGSDVLQVDAVNLTAHLDVFRHPWCGSDVVSFPVGMGGQLSGKIRLPREWFEADGLAPLVVHLPHFLYHFEQPRASTQTVSLQRGRDGQTNGLLRAAHVRHDKVSRQRVESSGDTFHRTVEALQVDGDVCSLSVGQCFYFDAKIQNIHQSTECFINLIDVPYECFPTRAGRDPSTLGSRRGAGLGH